MADERSVRLAATDLLLNRGLRFTINDAPVLLRLFRLNRIRIRPLKAGSIMEISRIMLRDDMEMIKEIAEANSKMDSIARIVAIAILNDRRRIKWYAAALSRMLLWKVSPLTLFQVYLLIGSVNKISDFMTITGYFAHHLWMMMNPRIPGQQQMGS